MTADSRRKRPARTRHPRSRRLIQTAALCASVLAAAPATVEAQQPDKVTGVMVIPDYSELVVTWQSATGADGYTVQLLDTDTNPGDDNVVANAFSTFGSGLRHPFTQDEDRMPLEQGVDYYVRIRGVSGRQGVPRGDWSDIVGPTTLTPPLAKMGAPRAEGKPGRIEVAFTPLMEPPDVDHYEVQWKKSVGENWDSNRQVENHDKGASITHIPGLMPGTEYMVRIRANPSAPGNDAGAGEWSDADTATPTALPAPVDVNSLTVKPIYNSGAAWLDVSWGSTPDATSYLVQLRERDAGAWQSLDPDRLGEDCAGMSTPTTYCIKGLGNDDGLRKGLLYGVQVIAIGSDPSDQSVPVTKTATTLVDPPDQVTVLTVMPGVEHLAVSFARLELADDYDVQWKSGDELFDESRQDELENPDSGPVKFELNRREHDLRPGTAYSVRVRARRDLGADDGAWSAPSDPVTPLAPGTPGVAISETALTVSEPEQTATYTVALTSSPDGAVNVNPMSADPGVARVSPNSLRFWASNWDTPQTVTVTAVNDDTANPDGQRTTTITHQVEGYGGVTADPVQVTVQDDDGGGSGPGTDPDPDPEPGTELGQVTGVMVTPVPEGLEVSWNAADNAERYKVRWRSVSGGSEGSGDSHGGYDGELITTELSVVIPDLDPDTEYAVQVTALRGDEEGPTSDEVMGTPLPEPPVITVTAAEESVTEGPSALAVFTLTADAEPASDLSVVVEVGQTGGYLAADDTGRREVVLPAGELEATVEVTIEDDTVEEEDAGTVTLTLQPGDGYEVAESPADTASVTVEDDDRPRREEQERQERQRRQERRQTGLQRGMSEVATIVGWDTAMTIRDRSLGVQDGGAQTSAANLLQPFASRLTGGMSPMGGGMNPAMGGGAMGAMNPAMGGMAGPMGAGGMGGMPPMGGAAMGAAGMGGMATGGGAMGMGGGMGSMGMAMGAGMPPMAGPATQPTSLFSGNTEFEMVLNGRSANPAPAPANPALAHAHPSVLVAAEGRSAAAVPAHAATLAHANPALATANATSAHASATPLALAEAGSARQEPSAAGQSPLAPANPPLENAHASASPRAFENGRPVEAMPASAAGHAPLTPANSNSASAHASANPALAHADPSALAFENGSALQPSPSPSPSGPLFRAWGRGARINYSNEALAGRRHDGDIRTILAGVDATWNSGLVFGVAAGLHRADVDFNDSMVSTTGNMSVSMWSVNPYASFQNTAGVRVWGTAGVGQGALDYGESGYLTASNLGMTTGTGGVEYEIASSGIFDVIGRTEGMFVNLDVDASSHPMVGYAAFGARAFGGRGELEMGAPVRSDTVLVRPYWQVAYRWDGGDAELGSSVEYGGGVAIKGSTVFLDAAVRSLTNTSGSFESLGYSVAAGYDGGADRRGLSLRFEQSAGPTRYNPYGGGSGLPTTFLPSHAAGQSYRARGGYGLDFGSGLLTPYMSADWGGYAGRSRLDWGAAWERFGVSIGGSYSLTTVGAFGALYGGAFGSPFGVPAGAASRTGADHAVQAQAQITF